LDAYPWNSVVGLGGYYAAADGLQHVIAATTDGTLREFFWSPGNPILRDDLTNVIVPVVSTSRFHRANPRRGSRILPDCRLLFPNVPDPLTPIKRQNQGCHIDFSPESCQTSRRSPVVAEVSSEIWSYYSISPGSHLPWSLSDCGGMPAVSSAAIAYLN